MKHQGLAPGVKDGKEAEFCAQMLWISRYCQQRLAGAAEQQIVNQPRVLESKVGKRIRQGEDYVVVGDREQFFLPSLEPFGLGQRLALGAVAVATRVVRGDSMPAPIALLDVTAECGRTTLNNCTQDAALLTASPVTVLLEESFDVPPNHIGDFKGWPGHCAASAIDRWKQVERADGSPNRCLRDVGIDCCGLQAVVTQQKLYRSDVGASFEQV